MTDFRDLGLRDELVRVLEDEDFGRPTALQQATLAVLRRGGNLVARASAGAGKTLAWTLGVFDRLRVEEAGEAPDGTAVRVLALRPTGRAAEHTALALVPYAQAIGLGVSVVGEAWGTPLAAAEVVVGTPEAVLEAVRGSELKFETIEAVVVDGASAIQELGGLEAVETLLDHAPRDAQRIVFTTVASREIEDLIDRRVKRALRYPAEPAVPEASPAVEGEIGYIVVAEAQKTELLTRALGARAAGGAPPVLFCRSDERAAALAEALTMRGFTIGDIGDEETDVVLAASLVTRAELVEEAGAEPGQTISYDVPPDELVLAARHRDDPDAIVLIEPRELPHLREIAARARLAARAVTLPITAPAATSLNRFRDELRRALREEDLGAQMLVLEPLFEEFSAAEVAAAATALLRRKPREAAPAETATSVTATAGAARQLPRTEAGPAPATWARLFLGIGSRDGIRPGDLVGAIAGEAEIPGSQVGKIEIRDTFAIVEVEAAAADRVIRALNGTTMKGRSLRVDYDRGADRARKPGARPHGRNEGGRRPGGGEGGARRSTGGEKAPRRSPVRRPRPPE